MTLDMRLAVEVLGPPRFLNTDPACWADLARLGARFPESHMTFVDAYGPGELAEFMQFDHPLGHAGADLRTMVLDAASHWSVCVENGELPRGFFPEPGGFLPFAASCSGDLFMFRWVDEQRYVICVFTDGIDYLELDDDFDEMIMKVLRRESPWPWYDMAFESLPPRTREFSMWHEFEHTEF
jgi:hypothetical protein